MTIAEGQGLADVVSRLFGTPKKSTGKAQTTTASSLSLLGTANYMSDATRKAVQAVAAAKKKPNKVSMQNVMNFKDPNELNSFADAMFNTNAQNSKAWIRRIPWWTNLGGLVPIRQIVAVADVAYNANFKPLFGDSNGDGKADWDFMSSGLNGLNNLTETLDVVANPVKGAIIEGFNMPGSTEGVNALQGFSRGLGMGKEGRTQYDYNVDLGKGRVVDVLVNLGLEMLSDPLNYVSFGASLAGKAAGKTAAKEVMSEAAEKASKSLGARILAATADDVDDAVLLVKQTFGETAAKDFVEVASGGGAVDEFVQGLEKQAFTTFQDSPQFRKIIKQAVGDAFDNGTELTDAIRKATQKTIDSSFDKGLWKSMGETVTEKSVLLGDLRDAIGLATQTTVTTHSRDILRTMSKIYRASEDTQKGLLKSVLYTNPFGLGLVGGKYVVSKLWTKVAGINYITKQLAKQYTPEDMRNLERLLNANELAQKLGKTAAGADAGLTDDAMLATIQMGTESELKEILVLQSKFTDPRVAQEQIAQYIRGKYNRTVSEYMDFLMRAPDQATLSVQGKALFKQHAMRLYYTLNALTSRVDAVAAARKLKSYKVTQDFLRSNFDEARLVALRLRDYILVPATTKNLATDIMLKDLTGSETKAVFNRLGSIFTRIKEDVRIEAFATQSPMLTSLLARDISSIKVSELDIFIQELKTASDVIHAEYAPVLAELSKRAEGSVFRQSITELIHTDPQKKFQELIAPLLEGGSLYETAMKDGLIVSPEKLEALTDDFIGYIVKTSQLDSAFQLLQAGNLRECVSYITSEAGIADLNYLLLNQTKLIDTPIMIVEQKINDLQMYAASHNLEWEIAQRITNNPDFVSDTVSHDPLVVAYLDSLYTYANSPFYAVQNNADLILGDIMRRMEGRLNGLHGSQHLNLDNEPLLRDVIASEFHMTLTQRALQLNNATQRIPKLFEQTNQALADKLLEVSHYCDIINGAEGSVLSKNLSDASVGIYEELAKINNLNVLGASIMLPKDSIPALGQVLGVPGVVNVSQLLNDSVEYFPGIGPKIQVHVPLMRTYFQEPFWKANPVEATNMAKHIDFIFQNLGDVGETLGGRFDEVKVLFLQLKGLLDHAEPDAKIEALKALRVPDTLENATAATLLLMREVYPYVQVAGNATVAQTMKLMFKDAVKPDLLDIFVQQSPLLNRPLLNSAIAADEIKQTLRNSSAHITAELELQAFEGRRDFFSMQEDMIQQWYRFDKKYKLIFADHAIERGKSMWKAVTEAAEKDPEFSGKFYNYMDSVCKNAAEYTLSLRGDALLSHVWHNTPGLIRIDFRDWQNDRALMEQLGIFLKEGQSDDLLLELREGVLYIGAKENVLNKTVAFPTAPPREIFKLQDELPKEVLDELRESRGYLLELNDGLHRLAQKKGEVYESGYAAQSVGALLSSDAFQALYDSMPRDIRKLVTLPDRDLNKLAFDYSNIGSPRLRKEIDKFASTSVAHTYSNAIETYLGYADSALKMHMMLTTDSSLSRFSHLFKDTPDEEALKALQADRLYRVVYAQAADTPFGFVVKELRPRSIHDIQLLRESEAIIVDHNTHRMLRNVFNQGKINCRFVQILNNLIISPTKAAMLSSAGFIVRNFVDSNMKNYASLNSPAEIGEFMAHSYESARWFHIYESDMKSILTMAESHVEELKKLRKKDIAFEGPDADSITAYFQGMDILAQFSKRDIGMLMEYSDEQLSEIFQKLTSKERETINSIAMQRTSRRDMFNLIHTYVAQGPSAGYIQAQQEVLDKSVTKETLAKMTWDEKIKHFAWTNPYTRGMMSVQSAIEQSARFSKFTWELMHDNTVAGAMHKVIETHFDYATKSKLMTYLEVFLPFTTFAIANAEFWTNLMSRSGWAFGALRDIYTAVMTPSDYSQYEMQNNRSLQYALLNGTIPLAEDGFGMKVNPSYMDVYNMLIMPQEAVKQRIAKAVSIPAQIFVDAIMGDLQWDEQLTKDVLTIVPGLGLLVQRWWNSDDRTLRGSALKAIDASDTPLEKLAIAILPTLFTDVGRAYYFNYPSTNEVWRTYDPETYEEQLAKGAVPVATTAQAAEIGERIKRTFYYGEKEYSTYSTKKYMEHLANGATTEPQKFDGTYENYNFKYTFYYGDKKYGTNDMVKYAEHLQNGATTTPGKKKTFVSFHTSTGYTRRSNDKYTSGVTARSFALQIRPFGQTLNLSYLAPAIWRRVYSAGGNDRFKVRLTKPTSKNLQYRIRMNWRYWR